MMHASRDAGLFVAFSLRLNDVRPHDGMPSTVDPRASQAK